jgi:hypothetical protein
MAERAPVAKPTSPSASVVYWRYLVFWVLLFAFLFFVSLYGVVADV